MYLKAKIFFSNLSINTACNSFNTLDLRKLFLLLESNWCTDSVKLTNKNYDGTYNYHKLPRCVRFYLSEDKFENNNFSVNSFYEPGTPDIEIIKDYCELFLVKYSDHKKTKKILNELKESNPELFI